MFGHFISATAGGPCSMCGERATHKVGEEIPPDDPSNRVVLGSISHQRHNLTAYVCCRCFTRILGPATGCPVDARRGGEG